MAYSRPKKNAPFIEERLSKFAHLYAKQTELLAAHPRKPIKITLPDGAVKEGTSWETTPLQIAQGISKKFADDCVVAKVAYTGEIEGTKVVEADAEESDIEIEEEVEEGVKFVGWDLTRPLEGDCKLQLFKFDTPEGQDAFWHSSSHVLGQALEREYGGHLTIGPALDNGFYYDCFLGEKKLAQDNFQEIENAVKDIVKQAQPFERIVMTKKDALDLFAGNPFKVQLITNKVPDGSLTSSYRNGPFIDLCRGPHLTNTGKVKAFKVMKNSAAYWLGKAENDSLQRIYGVSFPSDKLLKQHLTLLEEAAKRDHRLLGKEQELFFFHPTLSPGSCFWNPAGTRIYNKLKDFMRQEYRIRGFNEVITPNIYSSALFKTSGHWQNYRDSMYGFNVEKEEWFLKPMNCPGHCILFDHRVRSYKELPLRIASFGVLHRNELSGTLSGLTRVRRFEQDDAHIFCRKDQIYKEIIGALEFLGYVYKVFGFEYTIALSTRPKKALGSKALWDEAENALKEALNDCGHPWTLNPGDGAFYGPKIDIRLTDALQRKHQCGTIQLDFQLPIRFNLQFRSDHDEALDEKKGADDGKPVNEEKDEAGEVIWREGKLRPGCERPIIIHRAIFGSIERFLAILVEHTAGRIDFWLAPRQILIVPISEKYNPYATYVAEQLHAAGFHADADISHHTLNKKVRQAQYGEQPYYYVAVVGEKELNDLSVNLRSRLQKEPIGSFTIPDLIARFKKENMPLSKPLDEIEPFEGRAPQSTAAPAGKQTASSSLSTPMSKAQGAQLRKQNSQIKFGSLELNDDIETFLEQHPYVRGFTPSKADFDLYTQFASDHAPPKTPNLLRWFEHIASFSEAERKQWL